MKRQLKHLEEKGVELNLGRALDFGCGISRLIQGMAPFFESVAGVDIAPSMIDLANENNKFPDKCTYFLNEKATLSIFGDDSFDFVTSFIVLQHMQPDFAKSYILEFYRVLKPGGVMLFQVPAIPPDKHRRQYERSKLWYQKLLIKLINFRNEPVMEMHWIPKDEVVALVESPGMRIEYFRKDNNVGGEWVSYTYCIRKL